MKSAMKDNVKMRVFLLAEKHTIEQDIYMNVELDRSQCSLIRHGLIEIITNRLTSTMT